MTRPLHTVRTTRWPWRDIQVDDATLLDLTRSGQLLPRPEPEPEPPAVEPVADVETAPEPVEAPETPPKTRRKREPERQ